MLKNSVYAMRPIAFLSTHVHSHSHLFIYSFIYARKLARRIILGKLNKIYGAALM